MESTRIYGYARVSTAKQNLQRQIDNINNYTKLNRLYAEKYTGTKVAGREEFAKLKRQVELDVKAGRKVTVVFDSVSRMSRNADEGVQQYFQWYNMGIELVFLKERTIDTSAYRDSVHQVSLTGDDVDLILQGVNQYLVKLAEKQIRLAFEQAEKEAADTRQRVKEGMRVAKENGIQAGRKEGTKLTTKKSVTAKEIIRKHSRTFGGTLNDGDTMKLAGVSRPTYYKFKKELIAEANQEA